MKPPETVEQFANRQLYKGFPFATAETDTPAPHKTARVAVEGYGILTLSASHMDNTPEGTYTLSGVLRLGDELTGDPYKSLRMALHISDQAEDEPWIEAAPPDPKNGSEKAVVFEFVDSEFRDDQNRPRPKIFDITDLAVLELKVSESRLVQRTP